MNPSLILALIEAIVNALSKRKKVREIVLPLIQAAAADAGLSTNDMRREKVVSLLMEKERMSESTARLLTEVGLKLWKRIEAKRKKQG